MNRELEKQLEEIVVEVNQLQEENVSEWIEENVIEIKDNNELVITSGGPSISLYIDREVLIGQSGFSSNEVSLNCSTEKFEEFFEQFDM
mgnify:FL=1